MPKRYTIREMVKAWDYAYGEDLNDEEGFLNILRKDYGKEPTRRSRRSIDRYSKKDYRKRRKLSDWQIFIKKNSNKKKFKYANGKLKLKTMGIAYRKTAAYKRNKKK